MLIVEDGSIVAGANTYVDVPTLDTFLTRRGLTVPDVDKEPLIYQAMDIMETLAFRGQRVSDNQTLAFPRENTFDKNSVRNPSDTIPKDIILATSYLVHYLSKNPDFFDLQTAAIKEESIGPIKTVYALGENVVFEQQHLAAMPYVHRHLVHLLQYGKARSYKG